MDKIRFTDLSSQVLDAMGARNLKEKSIKEFERYGIRRIISYFEKNGQVFYSKEAAWDFVLEERTRVESGQLPAYQWAHTRRAAVYLEQMAEHGVMQEVPLPKWEAEHNRLFKPVVQGEPPAQDIETLICQVRDAMMGPAQTKVRLPRTRATTKPPFRAQQKDGIGNVRGGSNPLNYTFCTLNLICLLLVSDICHPKLKKPAALEI